MGYFLWCCLINTRRKIVNTYVEKMIYLLSFYRSVVTNVIGAAASPFWYYVCKVVEKIEIPYDLRKVKIDSKGV